MPHTTKSVAILIDGDNAQLRYIPEIIQFCRGYGEIKIIHAYGDWEKPPLTSQVEKLRKLNVDLVQQKRLSKNATDFRMMIEIGKLLNESEINVYFIVSSDTGFAVSCQPIRQSGAKVIGIGSEDKSSSILREACNDFFEVEKIGNNQPKPAPKPAAQFEVFEPLHRAYQQTPQQNGWADLGRLGNVLRQMVPQYKQLFAHKRLSTWLKELSDQFEVSNNRVRLK